MSRIKFSLRRRKKEEEEEEEEEEEGKHEGETRIFLRLM